MSALWQPAPGIARKTHATLLSMPQDGDLTVAVHGIRQRLGLGGATPTRTHLGAYVLVTSAISIALVSIVAVLTGEPFVFPSLGPTVFLLFYAATIVRSCPRNVLSGHLLGALCGYAALLMFGLSGVPADLEDVTWASVGAVTVAVGLLRTPGQLTILMLAVLLLTCFWVGESTGSLGWPIPCGPIGSEILAKCSSPL
ncbi:MAG: HPP family protein [Candidatus Nanopelagicales bacterium]